MDPHIASASPTQYQIGDTFTPTPLSPRPHQIEAAAALHHAIWNEEGPALGVAPVAAGKTLILCMVAVMAVERGCDRVVIARAHGSAKTAWSSCWDVGED